MEKKDKNGHKFIPNDTIFSNFIDQRNGSDLPEDGGESVRARATHHLHE
jgi:hypothetical protein